METRESREEELVAHRGEHLRGRWGVKSGFLPLEVTGEALKKNRRPREFRWAPNPGGGTRRTLEYAREGGRVKNQLSISPPKKGKNGTLTRKRNATVALRRG